MLCVNWKWIGKMVTAMLIFRVDKYPLPVPRFVSYDIFVMRCLCSDMCCWCLFISHSQQVRWEYEESYRLYVPAHGGDPPQPRGGDRQPRNQHAEWVFKSMVDQNRAGKIQWALREGGIPVLFWLLLPCRKWGLYCQAGTWVLKQGNGAQHISKCSSGSPRKEVTLDN